MTPKEQEVAIAELEERVDRLRTLYEQYFLGFEKLEPMVPRKDVERRFVLLRKEQIRNTALRFRFNVVTQKYNTYSMHWVRICRQIEEGTYKRHVRRAKARFGDGRAADRDISIDVDLGDFEDFDVDEVLAEADAAAEKYTRNEAPDTVPPPPPSERALIAQVAQPLRTPGTSFVVGGRREVLDEVEPNTPVPGSVGGASSGGLRAARPAVLPAGAKPRIVRKVARGPDDSAPASQRTLPGAPPATESAPASARTPPPSVRQPATSSPRMPAASSPRLPAPSSPSLESSPRIPAGAPSSPRMPVRPRIAPIAGGSAGKLPAAPPAASPSAGRLPAAPPAQRPAPAPPADPLGDKDTLPPPSMGPRSVPPGRSRAPLPLPSQLSQKKKE